MTNTSFLLAVDIGGTFTDIVLFNTVSYEILVGKVLTSYPDPSTAVLSGVSDLLGEQALTLKRSDKSIMAQRS
jgi:N-methylhydantoinase A